MIAEIIPLVRLPHAVQVFDYFIPETLENALAPGHLVSVPFRNKEILGIVSGVGLGASEHSEKIKPITKLVNPVPLLSATQLHVIKTVAAEYGVSWAAVALMLLPPLKKRRLQQTVFYPFIANNSETEKKTPGAQAYCLYQSKKERAEWYEKLFSGRTYCLVPRISDVQERFDQLSSELKKTTMLWHSELSEKEQFDLWAAWRNGEYQHVIGTRSAIFLPSPDSIDTIIIDEEHDEQHKHWDQAPRYHTKDIAHLLQQQYGAKIILMDFTPSVEGYYGIHREQVKMLSENSLNAPWPQPTILEHTAAPAHPDPLSPTLLNALDSLGENDHAFFLVNRRGYARALFCRDCNWYATCPQCVMPYQIKAGQKKLICVGCQTEVPLMISCLSCHSNKLIPQGYGVDQIAEKIFEYCKKINTHEILTITSDTTIFSQTEKPKIIIGTSAALPHINWSVTTLIAIVDFDRQISLPEFNATEDVRNGVQTIRFHERPDAQFFIQTKRPDHLIFRSFAEPDRWYRTELNQRRALGLPPYQRLIRFIYGNTDAKRTEAQAALLYQLLKNTLTKSGFSTTLQGPLALEPARFRNASWSALILKTNPADYKKIIDYIGPLIPFGWKYDPRPHSLFGH